MPEISMVSWNVVGRYLQKVIFSSGSTDLNRIIISTEFHNFTNQLALEPDNLKFISAIFHNSGKRLVASG